MVGQNLDSYVGRLGRSTMSLMIFLQDIELDGEELSRLTTCLFFVGTSYIYIYI